MDEVTRDWLRELFPEMEWQCELVLEEFAKLRTALAAATERADALAARLREVER